MAVLDGKSVLITGGTGSLGKVLLKRLLSFELGTPNRIIIFSRDEGKQHNMRVAYAHGNVELKKRFNALTSFKIGDVRDLSSLMPAVKQANIVVNTAALKQVPACEYFPGEAVKTNILGAMNLVQCVADHATNVETVVGISTDKAAKPVNVMGMTKAIQERVFLQANLLCPETRFIAVRYGNVLASRGSVIPLFHEQIKNNQDITITDARMTRFLLSLEEAVDIIFTALRFAKSGELYIPSVPSARITDLADVLIGNRPLRWVETGIRPGEKLHEILIGEDEARRAFKRGDYYVIPSAMEELASTGEPAQLDKEYSSESNLLDHAGIEALLVKHDLMTSSPLDDEEMIR
jgi:FlaA1/EpsC-like NDP-sugar epimerase